MHYSNHGKPKGRLRFFFKGSERMAKSREYKKGRSLINLLEKKNVYVKNSFYKHNCPLTFIPIAKKIHFFYSSINGRPLVVFNKTTKNMWNC
jgi:hypothetical protein